MRKSLKGKQPNKGSSASAKSFGWSARRVKTLLTYRSGGRAGYCNCANCGK
jgi:hypothetical protein